MAARGDKVYEFFAHQSPINCATLAKWTATVFATGGDDCVIQLWRLMKAQPVLTLTGHTTEIDSLCFDAAEKSLISGSRGGSIKFWDMEAGKLARGVSSGHRASVTSVDVHPYGSFFCSASTDTNVKVWDIRSREPLATYKGHMAGVLKAKFSPDGKLIASGDAEGVLKIWDLSMGKCISTLQTSDQPITCIDFHPSEFICAVGGGSRYVDVWDLSTDQMSVLCRTDLEATKVRCLCFSRGDLDSDHEQQNADAATALLVATQDTLKAWNWEPSARACLDTVEVGWSSVADMAINKDNQLIGLGFKGTTVTQWMVDLNQVAPFSTRHEAPVRTTDPTTAAKIATVVDSFQQSVGLDLQLKNKIVDKIKSTATPAAAPTPAASAEPAPLVIDEKTIRTELVRDTASMRAIFTQRLNHIRALRVYWQSGQVDSCLAALSQLHDPSVSVDILTAALPQLRKIFTLDMATVLLPIANELLQQRHDEKAIQPYAVCALECIQLVLESFASIIVESRSGPAGAGVDVAREMRLHKCNVCWELLMDCAPSVAALTGEAPPLSNQARLVNSLLEKLRGA